MQVTTIGLDIAKRFARALRRNHSRQKCNAEPGARQFGDEVDLAAARYNSRFEPLTSTRVENDPVERETHLEQNERCIAEITQPDLWSVG